MKHNVYVYGVVWVKLCGIEADTYEAACEATEELAGPLFENLQNAGCGWAEEILGFLVDEVDDAGWAIQNERAGSVYCYGDDGHTIVKGPYRVSPVRTSSQPEHEVGNYDSLEGARCPECREEEAFTVSAVQKHSVTYTGNDPMWCDSAELVDRGDGIKGPCGYEGTIDEFMKGATDDKRE